jgi:hypothetical protein
MRLKLWIKSFRLFVIVLFFSLAGCKHSVNKTAVKVRQQKRADTAAKLPISKAVAAASYARQLLYITTRDGISTWDQPDSVADNSSANNSIAFGTRVGVISIKKGWMEITNDECHNCASQFILSSCACAAPAANLLLNTTDLNTTYYDPTVTDAEGSRVPNTTKLAEFVLERISKSEFLKQKNTGVTNFKADTGLFPKKNGVLALKTQKKTLKLKDVQNGEDEQSYTYLGQYTSIHKLVIAGSYNESGDVFFVDQVTGKTIANSFTGFPYLSANQKYVVSVSTDNADDRGDINLYVIKKDTVIHMAGNHFQYWMPALTSTDFFWGSDGCFYFPFVPYGAYLATDKSGREEKGANLSYSYARIKFVRSLK